MVTRTWRTRLHWALVDTAFRVIKRPYYRRTFDVADVAVMQTPDTYDWLLPKVASGRRLERYRQKSVLSFLGFDANLLHLDLELRDAKRRELGIPPEDVVCVYSCRLTAIKRLDIWVSIMAGAMRRVPQLRAMLVGVRDDHEESRQVLRWIEETGLRDRFTCLPFAKREQLPEVYNAADFGCWYLQPAVSIQEAMGTGVYMVLTDALTVSHLLDDPETGRYFPSGDYARAEELVVDTAQGFLDERQFGAAEQRRRRAEFNARRFSYDALADRLLLAAGEPDQALRHLHLEGRGEPRPGQTIAADT